MSDRVADFEARLRQALAPIDPPTDLEARHKRRDATDNVFELAEHTLRDLAREAGRVIEGAQRRL